MFTNKVRKSIIFTKIYPNEGLRLMPCPFFIAHKEGYNE